MFAVQNQKMQQIVLSREERINRALDGRTQTSIIKKMAEKNVYISDADFSRCKKGSSNFTSEELCALSEILGTEITND